MEIADILGVTTSTIEGSFEPLFQVGNEDRLNKIISGVCDLRKRAQNLKAIFLTLKASLDTITSQNVGDDVADRMSNITEDMLSVPALQVPQPTTAWTNFTTVIKAFVDVLKKSAAADLPGIGSVSAVNSTTTDENGSYELAVVHRHDPGIGSVSAVNSNDNTILTTTDENGSYELAQFTPNNPSHSLIHSDEIEAVAGCAYYTTSDLFSSRLFSMVVGLHLKL